MFRVFESYVTFKVIKLLISRLNREYIRFLHGKYDLIKLIWSLKKLLTLKLNFSEFAVSSVSLVDESPSSFSATSIITHPKFRIYNMFKHGIS